MDYFEVLDIVQGILSPRSLTYVEEIVLQGSWAGKRYREIAQETSYEEGYLKDRGSRLWQDLSGKLGYPVTKKRLHFILSRIAQSPSNFPGLLDEEPSASVIEEFPGAPLAFGSPLYIQRPPVEELAIATLQSPGGLLRIMAPWRMGKTSLINHLSGQLAQLGQQIVLIDLRQADAGAIANLDTFLRWFCWTIGQQLNLECDLENTWFEKAGSKLNCTIHMQEQILTKLESPLVIALDTVHYLVEYPHIAQDFLTMLRSWYEQAKVRPQWQKLRIILAYVGELDVPLQFHQSPFNVGLLVEPSHFTPTQVHQLRTRYALQEATHQETASLKSLLDLVGGHPYLLQLAFYWLQFGKLSLSQILQTASTDNGIYREHLRQLWLVLEQNEALLAAFLEVLKSSEPVQINSRQAQTLADMGLVEFVGLKAKLQCQLYRAYFGPLLELECG